MKNHIVNLTQHNIVFRAGYHEIVFPKEEKYATLGLNKKTIRYQPDSDDPSNHFSIPLHRKQRIENLGPEVEGRVYIVSESVFRYMERDLCSTRKDIITPHKYEFSKGEMIVEGFEGFAEE